MHVEGEVVGSLKAISRDTSLQKGLGVVKGVFDEIPANRLQKVSWGMLTGDMPIRKGEREDWAEEGKLFFKCS